MARSAYARTTKNESSRLSNSRGSNPARCRELADDIPVPNETVTWKAGGRAFTLWKCNKVGSVFLFAPFFFRFPRRRLFGTRAEKKKRGMERNAAELGMEGMLLQQADSRTNGMYVTVTVCTSRSLRVTRVCVAFNSQLLWRVIQLGYDTCLFQQVSGHKCAALLFGILLAVPP